MSKTRCISGTIVMCDACGGGSERGGDGGGDAGEERSSKTKALAHEPTARLITVQGFVSKVGHGVGRSDTDRQFMFLNGRPVDLPKFNKVVNEVWRKYEMKHKSAIISKTVHLRISKLHVLQIFLGTFIL